MEQRLLIHKNCRDIHVHIASSKEEVYLYTLISKITENEIPWSILAQACSNRS